MPPPGRRRGSLGEPTPGEPTPAPNYTRNNRSFFEKTCGWVLTAAGKLINECRRGTRKNKNNTNIQPPRQAKLVEHIVAAQEYLRSLKGPAQYRTDKVTLENRLDNLNERKQYLEQLNIEYETFHHDVPQQAVSWIFNNYYSTLRDINDKINEITKVLIPIRAAESFYEAQEKEAERRWMASSEYRQWQKDQIYYAKVKQQEYTKQQIDTAFTMWWQDGDGANIYKNTSWIAERAMEDARDALEDAEWILTEITNDETSVNDIVILQTQPYKAKAENAVVVAKIASKLADEFSKRAAKDHPAAANEIRAGVIQMQQNAVQIWFNEAKVYLKNTEIAADKVYRVIKKILGTKDAKNARNEDKRRQESQQRPRPQAQQQPRPQAQQQPRPQAQQPLQPPPPPKKPTPDFYRVMGISKAATAAQIKKAYRTLAIKLHPDTCNEAKDICEKKFKELNQANMVLSVPKWKGKYDTINGNYTYEDLEREMEQDVADGAVRGGGRSRTMRRKRMGTSDALK